MNILITNAAYKYTVSEKNGPLKKML